jgi:hypothetical protein
MVVGAGLDHRHVERTEALADGLEVGVVAGVAAEEDAQAVGHDHPRRPQRAVFVEQASPREVLRGHRRQAHAAHRRFVPPVELPDPGRVHAPRDQALAHAQRRDEDFDLRREPRDGGAVQVVEVVVRQDHALDGRQLVDVDGRRMKPLRAGPLHR